MACSAIRAVAAFMYVITPVTADAGGRRRVGLAWTMTGDTRSASMLPDEPEARNVMVEFDPGPAGRFMTAGAVRSKPAIVRIVTPVTVDAFRPDALPDLIHVAGAALGIGMSAEQGERRCRVVEAYAVPTAGHVTGRTIGSQSAEMWIIILVTGRTFVRGICILLAVVVTTGALSTCMLSIQSVVGESVVKCCRIKASNIGCAPFVFGMARLALPPADLRELPVESGTCPDVSVNFIVAIEAKPRLGLLVKRRVTGRTLLLLFDVCLRKLAWRDKTLDCALGDGLWPDAGRSKKEDSRDESQPPSTDGPQEHESQPLSA